METRIWFEARLDTGCSTFSTEKEARDYIADAMNGFRDKHKKMTLENREYWKEAAKKMKVVKVTQTSETL